VAYFGGSFHGTERLDVFSRSLIPSLSPTHRSKKQPFFRQAGDIMEGSDVGKVDLGNRQCFG
jgi:hypothetical protein